MYHRGNSQPFLIKEITMGKLRSAYDTGRVDAQYLCRDIKTECIEQICLHLAYHIEKTRFKSAKKREEYLKGVDAEVNETAAYRTHCLTRSQEEGGWELARDAKRHWFRWTDHIDNDRSDLV
jgi:hypothetical protein